MNIKPQRLTYNQHRLNGHGRWVSFVLSTPIALWLYGPIVIGILLGTYLTRMLP